MAKTPITDKTPEMKCPECAESMEYHPTTCKGFYGNTTEGPHFFCSSCNIEGFTDKPWRRGK